MWEKHQNHQNRMWYRMEERRDNSTIYVKLTKKGVRVLNATRKDMRDHINRYWGNTVKGKRIIKRFADVVYPYEGSFMVWELIEIFGKDNGVGTQRNFEDIWFEDENRDV